MPKEKEDNIESEIRETLASINKVEKEIEDPSEEALDEQETPEGQEEVQTEESADIENVEVDKEVPNKKEASADPYIDPPVALSGPIKQKWKDLPPDVRAEWKKREDDIHRMMTSKEGELNLGRSIKEIATPYEHIIRAEGGTVEGAFKDLLNTAYVLRAGTPLQKAQAVKQAIEQFGVDLSLLGGQAQQGNPLDHIQRELMELKQQADPSRIKSQLQEEMERDRIANEIQAFAANPENVHFEAVKSTMGSLISSGRAKDLQEAYEMAIWSDPSIRTDLLKAQQAKEAEKKKAEMAAKKKASASVAGSPGLASPSSNAPQKSLEDEIRENLRASSGKI